MKILKKLMKVLAWTVVVVVALVLALPLWIGPVVKGVANSVVPSKTGAAFRLGEFGLNPYSGRLHVGDMNLANPPEFAKENCVELGALDVDVAMTTVLSKKIRIESVVLDGLTVAMTTGGGNFKRIARNAAGPEAETPSETAEPAPEPSVESGAEAAPADEPRRVQIDRLELRNLKVKIGMLPIPIPTIVLEGIGADKEDGATWKDVWLAVSGAVMKAIGAIGDLGKGLADFGVKAASETLDAATDAAKVATGAATDAAKAAAGMATDAATGAAKAAGAAAGAAVDAADSAVKTLKGLFKKQDK